MPPNRSISSRCLAMLGAMFAAVAVALAAVAAHAAHGPVQVSLHTAAAFALAHGIALAALAPQVRGRTGQVALWLLALGTLLFSGSLVARHVFGVPLGLAPFGGSTMILSWLLYAADALRR